VELSGVSSLSLEVTSVKSLNYSEFQRSESTGLVLRAAIHKGAEVSQFYNCCSQIMSMSLNDGNLCKGRGHQ